MDSLIHYHPRDSVRALAGLAAQARHGGAVHIRAAHATLSVMHAVGRMFPRGDRAPAIEPVSHGKISRAIAGQPELKAWQQARTHRVMTGFYMSQAKELVRPKELMQR